MTFRVPFIRPVFPGPEVISSDFSAIVESNWFTNFGPREREFASQVGAYVAPGMHAALFSNATVALMASLEAAYGPGDSTRYILVPSFTFAAGPEAIEWAGYRPLLIDLEEETLQPSTESARRALEQYGDDVAGILLCNTFGIGNPRIREWEELARTAELPLVIDSAAGFGSLYSEERRVGTAGLCEVFSFHATKPFAIGEGGAVVSSDADFVERLRSFSNFGFTGRDGARRRGLNGKLQEFNAAIGLRQLETFDSALDSRRATLETFRSELPADLVRFPLGIELSSVCFSSVVVRSGAERDALLSALIDAGIEARAYYSPAVHRQPYFAQARRVDDLAATEAIGATVLSIPVHQNMADEDVRLVLDVTAAAA